MNRRNVPWVALLVSGALALTGCPKGPDATKPGETTEPTKSVSEPVPEPAPTTETPSEPVTPPAVTEESKASKVVLQITGMT